MQAIQTGERNILQAFDYSGVTLGPSMFKDQYDQARDYYLNIPDNDILFSFRQRAGLASPGKPMGGWYHTGDSSSAHSFGQWLAAYARMGKLYNDEAIQAKSRNLLHEWGKTIAPDGYFGPVSKPGVEPVQHYPYDKLVGGLVDLAWYLDEPEALSLLERVIIGAWPT